MRLKNPLAFLVAASGLLAPAPVQAQHWVPVGPPGGDVRSLAVDPRDPQRIYLGTAEGVLYRSEVSGLEWHRLSPGFPLRSQSLDELVVSPSGTLLVGYWDVRGKGGGVAISNDRGQSFKIATGLEGESVRALALAPSDPRKAVAGTLTGVFASKDGGLTWRRITPEGHPDLRQVESVAFDPRDSRIIYVGTWHLPWKTLDGGLNWSASHDGMLDDSDVFTFTVDSRDPQRVFATACSGIYRSADAAQNWTRLRGIPVSSRRTRAFAQDKLHPATFYAGTTEGLWLSDDDTTSWRLATPKNIVVNALQSLPDGTLLLGAEGAGVLRSRDRGKSWTSSNNGFSERFVSRIVFDSVRQRVMVGVWGDRQHGGVLAAPTPRGPWTRIGLGLEGREILSLAAHGPHVLAGTDEGLYALSPDSALWRRLALVREGQEAHPRVADVLALPDDVLLAATARGVYRSGDAGLSWERTEFEGPVSALAGSPDDPEALLLATPSAIWGSEDGGRVWRPVSAVPHGGTVNALAMLPGEPRSIFAAANNGLYRSSDHGKSWLRGGWGLPHSDMTSLALHPDGRTVYVSDFKWGGVYRTEDRGQTWTRLSDAGLASDRVWTVGLDPASPDELLAGSLAGGLHLFTLPARAVAAGGVP
jgi:photosystem II stability/assembly factor-like uncharacterized protein